MCERDDVKSGMTDDQVPFSTHLGLFTVNRV